MLDDSRREVNPRCEREHGGEDGHHTGRTSASHPQPKKRDVPGHEGGENFAQSKETDRVNGARRNGQRIEQQVANPVFDRLMVG